MNIAERLEGFLADGIAEETLSGEGGGVLDIALEDQLADGRKALGLHGAVVIVGLAGPEGIFVELDSLVGDIAKDHGARRPLPTGRASSQATAGRLYQRMSESSGAAKSGAARRRNAAKKGILAVMMVF